MRQLVYRMLLFLIALGTACDTEEEALDKTVVCSKLADALFADNSVNAGIEIEKLLAAQKSGNTSREHYEQLMEELNSCSSLEVINSCYECVQTNPPQTEIIVSVTVNSQAIIKVIDLMSKDNKLVFVKIHD
ncbi:MAG: hypothetical protein ACO1OQ_07835 [Rufibacter sp.]